MSYSKRDNFLYIGQQLPSMNEYVNKCRTNPHVGAEFKRVTEENILMWINACMAQGHLHAIKQPCEIVIDFYEQNRRRDVDNIQSAQKFILDALQTAKIIPNDSQRFVTQIYHRVLHNTAGTGVYVYIIEGRHVELHVEDGERDVR